MVIDDFSREIKKNCHYIFVDNLEGIFCFRVHNDISFKEDMIIKYMRLLNNKYTDKPVYAIYVIENIIHSKCYEKNRQGQHMQKHEF